MVLVIISCLFVFLGMFIGNKFDLKNISINVIFGLFFINSLGNILPHCYDILYKNYHSATFIYVILGSVLGYFLMRLSGYKYEDSDNISIVGFTIFNSYLLYVSKFSFIFLIINILYYILIGIYVRDSKSWIFVIIGMVIGVLIAFINSWVIGYLFSIIIGFLIYFIVSVYGLVFRNKNKYCYIGLIISILIALLGSIL